MPTFEITIACRDEDWVYWRQFAEDYHQAVECGMARINMASVNPDHKLHDSRLWSVKLITTE